MLLSWETLSSSVISLDQLPFFFAGWKLLISLVCVAHLGFGVLGGGNRICDGEVTRRSQFLKPSSAVLWQSSLDYVLCTHNCPSLAWAGAGEEGSDRARERASVARREGKAQALSSLSSHSGSEEAGEVWAAQASITRSAFCSAAREAISPGRLHGFTSKNVAQMRLRFACRVFVCFSWSLESLGRSGWDASHQAGIRSVSADFTSSHPGLPKGLQGRSQGSWRSPGHDSSFLKLDV